MSERQEGPEVQRTFTEALGQTLTIESDPRDAIITTLLAEKQALEAERDRLAQDGQEARALLDDLRFFDHSGEVDKFLSRPRPATLRTETGGHGPVRYNVNTRFDPSRDFRETHSAVNPGWKPRTETGGE